MVVCFLCSRPASPEHFSAQRFNRPPAQLSCRQKNASNEQEWDIRNKTMSYECYVLLDYTGWLQNNSLIIQSYDSKTFLEKNLDMQHHVNQFMDFLMYSIFNEYFCTYKVRIRNQYWNVIREGDSAACLRRHEKMTAVTVQGTRDEYERNPTSYIELVYVIQISLIKLITSTKLQATIKWRDVWIA